MNYMEFFITSGVFTLLGYFMSVNDAKRTVIASTIDQLIIGGYLKTRGHGDSAELVKFDEE